MALLNTLDDHLLTLPDSAGYHDAAIRLKGKP